MKWALPCICVFFSLFVLWLSSVSPAQVESQTAGGSSGELEDEVSGVVVAMERKVKAASAPANAAPAQDEDSDTIAGVVISDPCEVYKGVNQFRVRTDDDRYVNVCMALPRTTLEDLGCDSDHRIALGDCEDTISGYVVASQKSVRKARSSASGQPQIVTLQKAVSTGLVSFGGLIGDGTNTASCQMPCTNRTDHPVTVCVPQCQYFQPDHPDCQTMSCTGDTCMTIPPHKTSAVALPTMCVSPHSVNPPPAKGRKYVPVFPNDCDFYRFCDHVMSLSKYLEEEHYYDQVPIPQERRQRTICQEAQWIEQARITGAPSDAITPISIRNNFLEKGHVTLESLTPEDLAKLDGHCKKIYRAAYLTWRLAGDKRVDALISGAGAAK